MSHAFYHARHSAAKWGGIPDDFIELHSWVDGSKQLMGDFRHRALRHHAEGCFMAERLFGVTITNSNGRQVPTRLLAEEHIVADLGRLPSFADWATHIRPQPWMGGVDRGKIHDHEDT